MTSLAPSLGGGEDPRRVVSMTRSSRVTGAN
jgi:hypothetical protein